MPDSLSPDDRDEVPPRVRNLAWLAYLDCIKEGTPDGARFIEQAIMADREARLTAASAPSTGTPDGLGGVDDLAQEIRRVDGSNSLGAGALAEALMLFVAALSRAAPSPQADEAGAGGLRALREANAARQEAWCAGGDPVPDLAFRGNELAGETGEVCNVIKKLERERHGWRGSRDTVEHLAEELADVVICADLVALTAGIDLDAAVIAKFNATSEKVGLPHRLPAPPSSPDETEPKP